jgi:hypothetical protein
MNIFTDVIVLTNESPLNAFCTFQCNEHRTFQVYSLRSDLDLNILQVGSTRAQNDVPRNVSNTSP